MSEDTTTPQVTPKQHQAEKNPFKEISNIDWSCFYPGIENNMLFVHGTPTQESLQGILNYGLKPGHRVTQATLARNVAYTTPNRYSGSYKEGSVLIFQLDKEDLQPMPELRLASEFAIGYNDLIPPSKIVAVIPKFKCSIFDHLAKEYRETFSDTRVTSVVDLLNSIVGISEKYIQRISELLASENNENYQLEKSADIVRLAQTLVWNELNFNINYNASSINFYAELLSQGGEENLIQKAMAGSVDGTTLPKWQAVKHKYELISAIHQQPGSGFENFTLEPIMNNNNTLKLMKWIENRLEKASLQ